MLTKANLPPRENHTKDHEFVRFINIHLFFDKYSLIYILKQIKLQIGPTNHSTHPNEKRKGENDSIGLYINISRKCHLHGSNFYILVISHIVIHKPHPLVAQKSSTRGGKDCICKISRNCHSHGSNF